MAILALPHLCLRPQTVLFFLAFLTKTANTVSLALNRPTMSQNSPLLSISVITSDELHTSW